MKLAKATLFGFALFSLLTLASCGTMRRAGKDLFVVAALPILPIYAGTTDAYNDVKETREAFGGGPFTEVASFPFYFVWHWGKHVLYGAAHGVDFLFTPGYGLAELHPYGPEIEPLDFYTGTWFDTQPDGMPTATDAESGHTAGR